MEYSLFLLFFFLLFLSSFSIANYRKANPKYIRAKVVGMANRSTIPVGQGEKNLCYGIASVPSEKGAYCSVFFVFE